MNQRRIRRSLLAIAITLHAQTASAWDGQTNGKIALFEATSLNNYASRIWLEDSPVMCSGGHRWAYLDGVNNKVPVFTLLMAKAAGTRRHRHSGNNHCRIEHIAASD